MIWTSWVVATSEKDAERRATGGALISIKKDAVRLANKYQEVFVKDNYGVYEVQHEDTPIVKVTRLEVPRANE